MVIEITEQYIKLDDTKVYLENSSEDIKLVFKNVINEFILKEF
jgi:hypothetical protein